MNNHAAGLVLSWPRHLMKLQNGRDVMRHKKMMNTKQVCEFVGISRTTLYRWMADDIFPRPLDRPGPLKWPADDILEWSLSCPRRRY
ncbi:helix-turn-helix transcriptional regulator [Kordiimonas sp. UBA4487]